MDSRVFFCGVRSNLMFFNCSLPSGLVEGLLGKNSHFLLFVIFVEVSQEIRKQLKMDQILRYFYNSGHFTEIHTVYLQ